MESANRGPDALWRVYQLLLRWGVEALAEKAAAPAGDRSRELVKSIMGGGVASRGEAAVGVRRPDVLQDL